MKRALVLAFVGLFTFTAMVWATTETTFSGSGDLFVDADDERNDVHFEGHGDFAAWVQTRPDGRDHYELTAEALAAPGLSAWLQVRATWDLDYVPAIDDPTFDAGAAGSDAGLNLRLYGACYDACLGKSSWTKPYALGAGEGHMIWYILNTGEGMVDTWMTGTSGRSEMDMNPSNGPGAFYDWSAPGTTGYNAFNYGASEWTWEGNKVNNGMFGQEANALHGGNFNGADIIGPWTGSMYVNYDGDFLFYSHVDGT